MEFPLFFPFPRTGGRALARLPPIGGKLSPKVTDEGRYENLAHPLRGGWHERSE